MAAKKRAAKRAGSGGSKYGYKSVSKDPLDLRDLLFEGSLSELPRSIDNRDRVPYILDQGEEGACTGFGLAAVVNYLIENHSGWASLEDSVSPRMLYENARRYDEWEGESYQGSSIRGAMKGWHRHGVCSWQHWPYEFDDVGFATPEAALEALSRPLGSYFRVRHLHLNHMHAALNETGILLASASVHDGWHDPPLRNGKPRIVFSREPIGGHAFALVGYDDEGFWVQNSWGDGWGGGGFAHLSYEDWLENGWDCWVARLGVPIRAVTTGRAGVAGRAEAFDYITDDAVVQQRIRGHYVRLGNDGCIGGSGRLATDERDVQEVFRQRIPEFAAAAAGPPRVALYAHGGLNGETSSARRIASFLPYYTGNDVYPVHFMWKTGAFETIGNIVREGFSGGRMQGWRDSMRERFADLLDEGIELATRGLGRALWREMKENARFASQAGGGAQIVADELLKLRSDHPSLQVHLIGHSAGSIFHAHLVPLLVARGIPIQSLSLFAPACTTELFESEVLPHLGNGIDQLALFNLTDEAERDDSVTAYRKSLLYLVSEAFEERRGTPLLGMEKFVTDASSALRRKLPLRAGRNGGSTRIRSFGVPANRKLESTSRTHGGFDNDEPTLNSMLRIVLGKNRPQRTFGMDAPSLED